MFISGALVWIGCVLIYISSKNQKLVEKPLVASVTYPLAAVAMITSWVGFSQHYTGVIAALVVLGLVMVIWCVTVLLLGHVKARFVPYLAYGGVITAVVTQFGGGV